MKFFFTTIIFVLLGILGLEAQTVLLETFDSTTVPTGWTRTQAVGDGWKFSTSADYDVANILDHTGNNGNYAWVDFSGNDANVVLESPIVNVSTLTTPFLEFYFESHSTRPLNPFNLMYLEAWNGTTWVNVHTFQGNTPFGWDHYEFNMTSYVYGGSNLRFRFRCESGGASNDYQNDLLLDDVRVMEAPPCPRPNNLVDSNITTSSVDLAWVENGTATSWQIQYGPQNFSLGSGTIVNATTNPTTITNLNPNSTYSAYVRSTCSANDTSQWVGPISFNTTCLTSSAPWRESFDRNSTPNCWTESGSESWNYSTSASFGAFNAGDHTGNNGNYAWIDGSSPFGSNQISNLETPFINVSTLSFPILSFWVFSNNPTDNTYNTLEVEVYDGANWNLMKTINSDQGNNWNNITLNLKSLNITGPIKARFKVTENSPGRSYYNDILIDDVEVKEAPNVGISAILGIQPTYCNIPVNIKLVVENRSAEVEKNVPWAIESNGAIIANGVIPTFNPNSMDTISLSLGNVGPIGSSAMIKAYTHYPPDQNSSNDTLTANMKVSYIGLAANITKQISCSGDTNGEITATSQNGLPPYSYTWSNSQTTAIATGLAAGTYTLTVTDSIGCSTTAALTISNPPVLNISTTATDLICNSNNSGNINTSVSGGVPNYSYQWSNGSVSPQLVNATAGTYTVSITDVNGCQLIDTVTLAEPTALVTTVQDNGNGTATTTVSGGTAPYTYQWSPNLNNQTTATATGLVDNNIYYVVVTDANGCKDVFSFKASVVVGTNPIGIAKNEEAKLTPNPASYTSFLDLKNVAGQISITITNTTGQVVFQQKAIIATGDLIELPVKQLNAGMYVVQATNGSNKWVKKLVVIK